MYVPKRRSPSGRSSLSHPWQQWSRPHPPEKEENGYNDSNIDQYEFNKGYNKYE